MTENLTTLRKELAEVRAGLDKAWATVQEMTVVALRDEAAKRGELVQ
jgi:hypothetical protein